MIGKYKKFFSRKAVKDHESAVHKSLFILSNLIHIAILLLFLEVILLWLKKEKSGIGLPF
jgi:hypothetical protein